MRCLVFISIFMVACTLHATTEFAQAVAAQQDNPENECVICAVDLLDEETQALQCEPQKAHTFHKACLDGWWEKQRLKGIQQSCPVCRREFVDYFTLDMRKRVPEFTSLAQFLRKMFCECW